MWKLMHSARTTLLLLLILVISIFLLLQQYGVFTLRPHNPTMLAKQMIFVTAKSWYSNEGNLQRFERKTLKDPWEKVGNNIPVAFGRNGLGWGVGMHGAALTEGPIASDNNQKSPVGIFDLGVAFGKAKKNTLAIHIPYKQVSAKDICVTDSNSKYYNQIIAENSVPQDWQHEEVLYKITDMGINVYGIAIGQNSQPAIPGRCACVFLHSQLGLPTPTLGCTVFPADYAPEIFGWIDTQKNPVLVQIPDEVYKKFAQAWKLPKI